VLVIDFRIKALYNLDKPYSLKEGEILQRVELILSDPAYRKHLSRNARHEVSRRFCRHDFQHLLDVARVTYILLLEAGELGRLVESCGLADRQEAKEVIYAAGLVHDIARWRQYETGEDHAEAGAELALPLLAGAGFSQGEIGVILAAVREHRTGAAKSTLLGERLCRADDLSRPCFQCGARAECHKFGSDGGRNKGPVY
jgi:HD superfamily phosphodiesterase